MAFTCYVTRINVPPTYGILRFPNGITIVEDISQHTPDLRVADEILLQRFLSAIPFIQPVQDFLDLFQAVIDTFTGIPDAIAGDPTDFLNALATLTTGVASMVGAWAPAVWAYFMYQDIRRMILSTLYLYRERIQGLQETTVKVEAAIVDPYVISDPALEAQLNDSYLCYYDLAYNTAYTMGVGGFLTPIIAFMNALPTGVVMPVIPDFSAQIGASAQLSIDLSAIISMLDVLIAAFEALPA